MKTLKTKPVKEVPIKQEDLKKLRKELAYVKEQLRELLFEQELSCYLALDYT